MADAQAKIGRRGFIGAGLAGAGAALISPKDAVACSSAAAKQAVQEPSRNYYFTFAYSTPYEPYIPLDGIGRNLFFPDGRSDPRNEALIELRRGLADFIEDYQPDMPQRYQWPLNIET